MTDPAVQIQLLRTQLEAAQLRYTEAMRKLKRTETAFSQWMNFALPGPFSTCIALKQPLDQIGRDLYAQFMTRWTQLVVTERQAQAGGSAPVAAPAPVVAPAPEPVAAPASEPVAAPVAAPAPEPVVAPALVAPTVINQLSDGAVNLLAVLGRAVLLPTVEVEWENLTGTTWKTAKNDALPQLLRLGLVQVVPISGAIRPLRGYASDTNYVLTPLGRQVFMEHFRYEPLRFEDVYAGYASPECWWLHRVVKALILAGNDHPDNKRHTYTVYDPVVEAEAYAAAGFFPSYGTSEQCAEPDLVVVCTPRTGGQAVHLAIECEYANYSTLRLKGKLSKTVKYYAEAGFQAVYYIAPNANALGLIYQAYAKCLADLREGVQVQRWSQVQWWPDRAFFALFNVQALKDTWLPTARFIEQHYFNPEQGGMPATDWPASAARPERFFRYRWPKDLREETGGGE